MFLKPSKKIPTAYTTMNFLDFHLASEPENIAYEFPQLLLVAELDNITCCKGIRSLSRCIDLSTNLGLNSHLITIPCSE
jgi:hypothetical protein